MSVVILRRVNPEAYQAYLEGRYHTNKWGHDEFKKAESLLRKSVDLDPTFAPAYSATASLYTALGIWGIRPATEVLRLANTAALKALELDDGLAEAHGALGLVKLIYDWDWAGTEREHKRAVLLNPRSADAHTWYSVFLTAMGRHDEALSEAREAARLDPVSPSPRTEVAWVFYWARRHDEAISQLDSALELDPNFAWAYTELAWNYEEKRMYPEAIANCGRALDLNPEEQVILANCGRVWGQAGRRQEALALLTRLEKLAEKEHVDPWYIARLYDGMGDTDHCIEYLQRAYNERSSSLFIMKVAPVSERLRADPRFQALLTRLKFPA